MLTRLPFLFTLPCLFAGFLNAASDPFCGQWKMNPQKSKLNGQQMKIEDLGNNKFRFSFGNGSDAVVANGTDQPVRYEVTMSLTKEGANGFKIVYKKDGKVISSLTLTLSADENSLTNKGTTTKPDGSTSTYESLSKRVGTGSGWSGTWESTNVQFSSPGEWDISPYGAHGLTFYTPDYKDTLHLNFDGQEYTETGPYVATGSTSSGRRVNAHTLELTDKIKGKVMDHSKMEVSPDGRTLTVTMQSTGQSNPQIGVYEKM